MTITILALALILSPHANQAAPRQQPPVTFPSQNIQAIPQDAMYALGVQGGKIDDMSKRLDGIDMNVQSIKTDVDHLDVYASILGVIFLLIVAPLVFEGIRRWIWPKVKNEI
jgi:hypothetical protein